MWSSTLTCIDLFNYNKNPMGDVLFQFFLYKRGTYHSKKFTSLHIMVAVEAGQNSCFKIQSKMIINKVLTKSEIRLMEVISHRPCSEVMNTCCLQHKLYSFSFQLCSSSQVTLAVQLLFFKCRCFALWFIFSIFQVC